MADIKDILLGGIALVGAGYAISVYDKAHKGQQARNLRLKIASVGLQDGDIVMSIKILNPNTQDMQVQSFVGEMMANNQRVANVQMFGDYTAKGNNEITIPLILKPVIKNLVQQFANLFRMGGTQVKFTGTINVNNQAIPIVLSYNK